VTDDSDVKVGATKIPGPSTRSQASVGSDTANNQLEVTTQNSIVSIQGSKGVGPCTPLPGELEWWPAYLGMMSNRLGWEANVSMSPFAGDSASDGVQVSRSLFPSVPCSDRRASIDNAQSPAQSPTPIQQYLYPPLQTKEPCQQFVRNDNTCRGVLVDRRAVPKRRMAVGL
jgi:hypothetical protein